MGSARTHHDARRKLRKRLEEEGATPEQITAAVEAKKIEQGRAVDPVVRQEIAAAAERSRRQAEALDACTHAEPVRLDDRGFRPPKGDPILTGPARATGATAKAVKRSKALTKWEWDEMEGVG